MKISQVLYRVRQFWLAWRAQPLNKAQLAPARSVLTAPQMELFSRLQPSEQIHALRVLQTIVAQGETDPDLQTAALLHDIGKIRAPLHLWERVAIVLAKRFFPERATNWGDGSPQGWARPFVVAEQHPAWGGELAEQAGTHPRAAALIRWHQTPRASALIESYEKHLLSILQAADRQN